MTVDTRTRVSDGTRIGALWAGVMLPAAASLVVLELGYVLAQRACATGQMLPVHVSYLGGLLVALAGGALAWREWSRWRSQSLNGDGGRAGRSRFLALLGILSGGLFALVIVAQWSAVPFLHPCQ